MLDNRGGLDNRGSTIPETTYTLQNNIANPMGTKIFFDLFPTCDAMT